MSGSVDLLSLLDVTGTWLGSGMFGDFDEIG